MQNIRLADALDQMNLIENGKKKPFDIVFCTVDKKRKTGGDIVELRNVTRVSQKHNMQSNETIGVFNPDNLEHPYAVHTWLILKFNNMEVLL